MRRVRVTVSGRVQGVNFRWATHQKAIEVGVSGWVRNLPNRDVEAEFQGEEIQVEEMLNYVKKGPPAAHVIGTTTEELPPYEGLDGFEVRATY